MDHIRLPRPEGTAEPPHGSGVIETLAPARYRRRHARERRPRQGTVEVLDDVAVTAEGTAVHHRARVEPNPIPDAAQAVHERLVVGRGEQRWIDQRYFQGAVTCPLHFSDSCRCRPMTQHYSRSTCPMLHRRLGIGLRPTRPRQGR